ncbi:MAG: hypothetical protein U0Q12_06590 [Vicinamibacterales bacterium]
MAGAVFATCLITVAVAHADERVKVSIHDGRVTLQATQASLREILAEWARVGQVRVVNAERLAGPPLTLQLLDVPEKRALDTLLRSAAGYLVAPRAVLAADASVYDRLIILTTSTASGAAPTVAAMPNRPPAAYPQPMLNPSVPEPEPVVADDPPPPVDPNFAERPPETQFDYANPQTLQQFRQNQQGETAPAPAPMFFPNSATGNPQGGQAAPTVPTAAPSAGQTTTRPGQIVQPATPQQQQFRNPYGIPGDVAPGSVEPPANLEPDRSKYANPYQPTPPPPPRPPGV